jgi:cytoskeletal protein RodZ
MSETTPAPEAGTPPPAEDRVGDILRKERITKRIALETIARDLKLNVRYIKSIEANDYNDLPAEPYIRVYLRSMAKYLALDPEEIIKRFYRERGITTELNQADRPTTKLDDAMKTHEQPPKTKMPWPVIAGLIGVLIVIAFIASKIGQSPAPVPVHPAADTLAARHQKTAVDTIADSIPEKRPDSLDTMSTAALLKKAALKDTVKTAAVKDTAKKTVADTAVRPADSLTLVVRAATDSVWLQVFTDGKVWKNTLLKGESRIFRARDSLNVHVGNNSAAQYAFNGKPLAALIGTGIVTFKADKSGIVQWPLTKWMTVFKNRVL